MMNGTTRIKCSNCGNKIPFDGQVCPFCHADKRPDKAFADTARNWKFLGLVVGGIFGAFAAPKTVWGFGVFAILGLVVGAVIGKINGRKVKEKILRELRQAPPVAMYAQPVQPMPSSVQPTSPTPLPGTYVIMGVDKATGRDVAYQIQAASPENAKVKAELAGVVVTAVRRQN
jgi:RNA polymerase subunit RPABC4/transcription elongation factor Spt4